MKEKLRRMVAGLMIAVMSSVALAAPLDRAALSAKLVDYGVAPAEADARVAALTDEEAAQLAAGIDSAPAGGRAGGFLVFMVGVAVAVVLAPLIIAGTVVYLVATGRSGVRSTSSPHDEAA